MTMSDDVAQRKVKRPLSPVVLEEIGALNVFPEYPVNFDPGKNWNHLYRIWLNHGFWGQLNLHAGFLLITRRESDLQNRFTLTIEQKAVNWEGIVNTVQAEIECSSENISSPLSWKYTSRFTDSSGSIVPELTVNHTGRHENHTLFLDINGKKSSLRTERPITCDWCLFDAVQRLPFDISANTQFDIFEGLNVVKEHHTLSYREKHNDGFKKMDMPLYCFFQIGNGVLPYEYWLDKNHRLLMITSGDRLYILDDHAQETFNEEVAKHRGGEYSWQNKL